MFIDDIFETSITKDLVFDPSEGRHRLPKTMKIGEPTEWRDWRNPEDRVELFLKYYKARRLCGDLDHTREITAVADYHNMNFEERAWLSFLFGMTYKVPQAYTYWQAFPDFHKATVQDFEDWNAKNWSRTVYGTDARYNKGHFAEQASSIKVWLGGLTFEEKISKFLKRTQEENFWDLYKEVCSLHKYGRMTTWLTSQGLWDLLKLPISIRSVLVEHGENWSSYNGICYMMLKEHKMFERKGGHGVPGSFSPSKKDLQEGAADIENLWRRMEASFPTWEIDGFRLETALCQYKKLFTGVEYIGHAAGDAAQSLLKIQANFPEFDYTPLKKSALSLPKCLAGRPRIKTYNTLFQRYGVLLFENLAEEGGSDNTEALGIDLPEPLF